MPRYLLTGRSAERPKRVSQDAAFTLRPSESHSTTIGCYVDFLKNILHLHVQ
jgi:hypothetical protein